jgi:hypothetical protein
MSLLNSGHIQQSVVKQDTSTVESNYYQICHATAVYAWSKVAQDSFEFILCIELNIRPLDRYTDKVYLDYQSGPSQSESLLICVLYFHTRLHFRPVGFIEDNHSPIHTSFPTSPSTHQLGLDTARWASMNEEAFHYSLAEIL